MESISCRRCGRDGERLEKPPFRNDLGQRIQDEICRSCWSEWLDHQTLLINHYGLDVRDPEARSFLYGKIEEILLEGGADEDIDTGAKGSVEW